MGENLPDLPGRVWTGAPRLRVGDPGRQFPGRAGPCRAVQVCPGQRRALGPRRRQLMFGERKRSCAREGGRGCPQLGKPRQRGPGCRELSGNVGQLWVCDSGRLLEGLSTGCGHEAVADQRETGRPGGGRGERRGQHRPCGVNPRTAVGREVRTPGGGHRERKQAGRAAGHAGRG